MLWSVLYKMLTKLSANNRREGEGGREKQVGLKILWWVQEIIYCPFWFASQNCICEIWFFVVRSVIWMGECLSAVHAKEWRMLLQLVGRDCLQSNGDSKWERVLFWLVLPVQHNDTTTANWFWVTQHCERHSHNSKSCLAVAEPVGMVHFRMPPVAKNGEKVG